MIYIRLITITKLQPQVVIIITSSTQGLAWESSQGHVPADAGSGVSPALALPLLQGGCP